ncbi:MAG: hypothetical protein IPM60_16025 [Rhodospirillales bacterium]|nr:hypothetical protein [Rhodospirillales bacterium]
MTVSITEHGIPGLSIATTPRPASASKEEGGFRGFGEDGPTFFDVLDIVNPLQHIPVVSTLYRELTGDQIDPVPRMAGGALFGGLIGAIASIVNVVVDEVSGKDVGEHVLALFDASDEPGDDGSNVMLLATSMPRPAAGTTADGGYGAGYGADLRHEHAEVPEWAQRELAQRQSQDLLAAIAAPPSFAAWVPEPPERDTRRNEDAGVATRAQVRYQQSAMMAEREAQPMVDIGG